MTFCFSTSVNLTCELRGKEVQMSQCSVLAELFTHSTVSPHARFTCEYLCAHAIHGTLWTHFYDRT